VRATGAALALLLLAGCGAAAAVPHGRPASAARAALPRVRAAVERLRSTRPPYTAELHVPRLVWPGHGAVARRVDAQIDAWVSGQVDAFAGRVAQDLRNARGLPASLPPSRLTLTFRVGELDAGVASFEWLLEPYLRGAASPAQRPAGLTFDLVTGRPYTLASLFRAGTGYRRTLAGLGAAGLRGFHPAGARCSVGSRAPGPTAASVRAWWLSPAGLVLAFPAGRFTAAYCGPPAITVPFAKLRGLAAPGSPLDRRAGA
jgi:hypothetical protein